MVVFIDDLDRCQPDQMMRILVTELSPLGWTYQFDWRLRLASELACGKRQI